MAFSYEERDNKKLKTSWKEETREAGFFDIRYKGKKFTQEQVGNDGELTPEFKAWMEKNLKDKNFDWKAFGQENDIDGVWDKMENTSKDVFRFSEDCLYLTDDNVLGIKFEYFRIHWTYSIKKQGGSYYNSEFQVYGSKKDGLYHYGGKMRDLDKIMLTNYDFDGEFFIKKPK